MALWSQLQMVDQPAMQAAQAQVRHSSSCRSEVLLLLPEADVQNSCWAGAYIECKWQGTPLQIASKHCSTQCRDLTLWARRLLNDLLDGIVHNFAFHKEPQEALLCWLPLQHIG